MNDPTRTTIAQFLPTPAITGVLSEGTRLMEYEIRHVLGKPGGFGVTYLALDTNLDLEVAIKEYLPVEFALRGSDGHIATRIQDDDAAFAWGLRCFLNEARMLARFHHPNVVQVHRLFEANGSAYIVMEHVRGQSLGENLRQQPLTTQERLEALLLPLLDGLETVHNAGVLHRDLKPENILLRDDGTPVLIDFGAARGALGSRSQSLLNVLTAGYAPLEQYSQNGNQGPWTDIYALGAVLYRALTGRKPPDAVDRLGEDPVAPLHTVVGPGFDPRFLGAIDWALQVPSNQRPQSVAEWRSALAGASHVPVPVTAADVVPAALDLDLSPDADPTAPLELQEPEQSRPVAPVPAAIPVMSPLPSTPPPQRKPAWLLRGIVAAGVAALLATVAILMRDEPAAPAPVVQALPPPAPAVAPTPAPAPVETAAAEPPAPTTVAMPEPSPPKPEPAPAAKPPKPKPAAVPPVAAPVPPPSPTPTPAVKARPAPMAFASMLEAHNHLRQQAGVAALGWSSANASEAQRWADQLATEDCRLRFNPDSARRSQYRDNLFQAYSSKPYQGWLRSADQVVARWDEGRRYYNSATASCSQSGGGCNLYAQIVAAGTREVGCARARCEAAEVWVCTYSPPR